MEGCFLMIHFILDSTSGVSKDILDKYPQIHKVPLYMFVDGEYRDESEFTIDDVIEYSEREKKAIQTSQPSTGDYMKLFESIPQDDEIIIIALSVAVSGTYNGAVLAARQSGRKKIAVINSRSTAIGMIHLLRDGLEMVEQGLPFEKVVEGLQDGASRIRTTFTMESIEYLRRGGRVGKADGLIGSILKIRPVIYLTDEDEVDALAKVRTQKKGIEAVVNYLHEQSPCKRIGVVHIKNLDVANALRDRLSKEYPDIDITVSTGTPVLTCYLGPGLVGIIFEKAN